MQHNEMFAPYSIAVIIPCYQVHKTIEQVIGSIPSFVSKIICVDDKCPGRSGEFIKKNISDPRVIVLFNEKNLGVGGAVKNGISYVLEVLENNIDIIIKLDGDGQMDTSLMHKLILPIIQNKADYCKGNRFYSPDYVQKMPLARLFGNAILSFMTKFSTGAWHVFDPTNGYVAMHTKVAKQIPWDKMADSYFFETDIIFRLCLLRAVICDVPMPAIYEDEESYLKINKIIPQFLYGHFKIFFKRIIYLYFLRGFSLGSISIMVAPLMMTFGVIFGLRAWHLSCKTGITASAGTVMLSALPIIMAIHLIVLFWQEDMNQRSYSPLHVDL